jgi:hypothetical protein
MGLDLSPLTVQILVGAGAILVTGKLISILTSWYFQSQKAKKIKSYPKDVVVRRHLA